MPGSEQKRLPIVLVTGFLGSGKTTLLRNLAANTSLHLIFLVNEFSNTDVDSQLIRAAGMKNVLTIAGGSIFCQCKVADFFEQFDSLRRNFNNGLIDGVVIETSGITDPRPFKTLLHETGMEKEFSLACAVTVLDPGRFLKLKNLMPVIAAQVQSADVVLLNKIDLYPTILITEAEGEIRRMAPWAKVIQTAQCSAELDWFSLQTPLRQSTKSSPSCRDFNFDTLEISEVHPDSFDRLQRALQLAREDVYRMKGIVPDSNGKLELWEDSGHGLARTPAPAGTKPSHLVVVCRSKARDIVRKTLEYHIGISTCIL